MIPHDAAAIEAFLEDALGVDIGLEIGPEGIAVTVETDEGTTTTVVENVGEAIRTEVEEAVDDVDVAASYDLEDVEGIGPTYAGRLRAAGIDSISELVVTDAERVADVAEAGETLARGWIERARALVGADGPVDAAG